MSQWFWRTTVIGLVFAGAALAGMAPALAAAQNWIESYYDGAHTGYNSKETTLSVSNVASLQLEWGSSASIGAVAGFALDAGVIYAEGFNPSGNLAAINATTGATLWTASPGNVGTSYTAPVAAADKLIFAQCSLLDSGGTSYGAVCAYKKSNGALAWQWSNPCNCLPEGGLNSSLVYANGAVYFGYSNGGAGGSEYYVAVDAKSGGTLWTYGTGGPNTAGSATLTVGSGLVFVACSSNGFKGVCALNQTNGILVWSANIGSNALGFTVADKTLFVNVHYVYEALALNALTGAQLWSYTTDGTYYPAAFAKGVVYAVGSSHELFALKAKTGTQLWADTSQSISSSPSIANGVIYVGQAGNNAPAASAFDASNGTLLWSSPGAGYGYVSPLVANGVVYTANAPCGVICAFGLPGGKLRK